MKGKLLFAGFATVDFIEGKKYIGGAAGASSINAAKLGYNVSLITVLSNEGLGKWYRKKLSDLNIDASLCNLNAPSLPTCSITNPTSEKSARIWKDNGSLTYFKELKPSGKKLSMYDLIFLYNAPYELVEKISKTEERKIIYIPGPQIVNGKNKISKYVLEKSYLVFGNEQEENEIMKHKPFQKGVELIIITLGKRGGKILTHNDSIKFDPPLIKKVVDVTGAGDSFALGFSLILLNKKYNGDINKKLIMEAIANGKKLSQKVLVKKGSLIS